MKSNELTPNMYSVDKVKGLEVLFVCRSYMTTLDTGLGASSWGPANTMREQDLRILQEAQLWEGATLALGQYLPLLLIKAKANIAGGKELPWSVHMPQIMVNQIWHRKMNQENQREEASLNDRNQTQHSGPKAALYGDY